MLEHIWGILGVLIILHSAYLQRRAKPMQSYTDVFIFVLVFFVFVYLCICVFVMHSGYLQGRAKQMQSYIWTWESY